MFEDEKVIMEQQQKYIKHLEDKYRKLKKVFDERLDSKSDKAIADWFEENCQNEDNKELSNDRNQAISSCISVVNSIRDKTSSFVARDVLTTVEEELNTLLRNEEL